MSNVVKFSTPVDREMAMHTLDRLSKALELYENEVEAKDVLPEGLQEDIGCLIWAAEVCLQAALGTGCQIIQRAAETLESDPAFQWD